MLRQDLVGRVVAAAVRRPLLVIGIVAALALAGGVAALRLESSADIGTLADRDSESFKGAERFKRQFGEDAIVVLIKGDLQRTLLTPDLRRVLELEGCLTGRLPERSLAQVPAPCRELSREKLVKVVYGPGNLITRSTVEIQRALERRTAQRERDAAAAAEAARRLAARDGEPPERQDELAESARRLAMLRFEQEIVGLALRYGITSVPRPDNPQFVSQLVFDTSKGPAVPKARFAYLFPRSDAALMQVRLRPDLTEKERESAIDHIKAAVGHEAYRLAGGQRYLVSGVPVVVAGVADEVERSILVLLVAAVAVMAATLALVFRTRLRMLPLAIAIAAAALTYGALSLAGRSVTMASIAALPVLIGLAVDYAIQFQARHTEARSAGHSPAVAASVATAAGGATIASAGLATAAGFMVLLLSPVPMVRGFGLLVVLGVALAFGCMLTAGFATLARFSSSRPGAAELPPLLPRARRVLAVLRSTAPAHATAALARRLRSVAAGSFRRALGTAVDRPRRVLAVGVVAAACGLVLDTQAEVVSDVRELVPGDLPALRDARALEEVTGVTGEIDVTVSADDLTRPEVLRWMTDYQSRVLATAGYRPGSTCAQPKDPPELCPALSLPDLLRSTDTRDAEAVRALLAAVPPYFSRAVISDDRRFANLAFGIRLVSADRQREVVEEMERQLDPPPGVTARVTGLPVLVSEATEALSSPWRRLGTLLAGLGLVFAVLLAVRRRARAAAVPLIPIALAAGWSALVLAMLGIPLNPMSASLGALMIAISTEFSVLLSARYDEERRGGAAPRRAIELAYGSTGAAVLASGATAIAGFAALIASDIRMLRDFGAVTVVDLTVSLLGVMVVLPAALVWAEQHGPFVLGDIDPRPRLRRLFGRTAPDPGSPPASAAGTRLVRLRPRWRRSGA